LLAATKPQKKNTEMRISKAEAEEVGFWFITGVEMLKIVKKQADEIPTMCLIIEEKITCVPNTRPADIEQVCHTNQLK
jgi:hypothetical protein